MAVVVVGDLSVDVRALAQQVPRQRQIVPVSRHHQRRATGLVHRVDVDAGIDQPLCELSASAPLSPKINPPRKDCPRFPSCFCLPFILPSIQKRDGKIMQDQAESTFQTVFKFIKLGVGGCLVLFALFLLRPDSDYIQQMQRLEYEGHSTQAKLIDKIVGRSSSPTRVPPGVGGAAGAAARSFAAGKRLSDSPDRRSDGDFGRLFYLEYVFKTPAGEEIKDQGIVSAEVFDSLAVGATMEIIYLPGNPKINRLIDHTEPFNRMPQGILITASIIIGSIGALLIWLNWPSRATITAGVAHGGGRNAGQGTGGQGTGRVTRSVGASRVAPPARRGFHAPRKSFD